ncbi:Protoporphyrinogen oxidase [Stieleria neptunia]|uniref:Coproporphyrinogen III oxidase n=1 Tax=Stieleria neptunia TaxID=2527979 RepID=A0A518I1V5_9BACT|nr:protoporphyrinogen oxidase [Stieleria neptunia]QDV47058.1 Protoporphyrinogen oxidase [Stieleria neptunia]
MNRRVTVIGGGISGLAAATHLRRIAPEIEVRLLESGPRLGGVIQTTHKDGFLIEGAADNFITTSPTAIQLCQDVGLGDELIGTNPNERGAMVLSRGKLEKIPEGFYVMAPSRLWPLLTTKILSPKGKLRSGCEVFVPRKREQVDESLKSFVCRRFGTEMFERLVQPLVGGIYSADPNRLSIAATMPRFLDMEQKYGSLIRGMLNQRRSSRQPTEKSGGARDSQFMTLRGGMSQLIEALERSLPKESVRLNTPANFIVPSGSRWSISSGIKDPQREESDAVIVAAPASHASRMLSTVDGELSALLGEIQFASCAVVSLAFRREQIGHDLNSFGFVVPAIEGHFILSCSFSSVKYGGRAPDGTVLMRVFIGGACQSGLLRLPDTQLLELAHWEVAKLLDIEGEPLMRHITRQRHAMPQYHVGHRNRIAKINQRLEWFPTLALAGGSLSGVGVPSCIESGQKAAERIVAATRKTSTVPVQVG